MGKWQVLIICGWAGTNRMILGNTSGGPQLKHYEVLGNNWGWYQKDVRSLVEQKAVDSEAWQQENWIKDIILGPGGGTVGQLETTFEERTA